MTKIYHDEIVADWLKTNGYDGLELESEKCWCSVLNIWECCVHSSGPQQECTPWKKAERNYKIKKPLDGPIIKDPETFNRVFREQ